MSRQARRVTASRCGPSRSGSTNIHLAPPGQPPELLFRARVLHRSGLQRPGRAADKLAPLALRRPLSMPTTSRRLAVFVGSVFAAESAFFAVVPPLVPQLV